MHMFVISTHSFFLFSSFFILKSSRKPVKFDFKKTVTISKPLMRLAEEAQHVREGAEEEGQWIRKNFPKLSKAASDVEAEAEVSEDEDNDDENEEENPSAVIVNDWELKYNELRSEESYWTSKPVQVVVDCIEVKALGPPQPLLEDEDEDSKLDQMFPPPPRLLRQDSAAFMAMDHFIAIDNIDDLCRFKDKNGNSAAHHAASIGLNRTAEALHKHGAPRWLPNNTSDTPAALRDGLRLGSGVVPNRLHRALTKRSLLPRFALRFAFQTPLDYRPSPLLDPLLTAIFAGKEDEANYYSNEAIEKNFPHAYLYRAIFFLEFNFGLLQAKPAIDLYMASIEQQAQMELDPLYYLARYLFWKRVASPSNSKSERLLASDALTALRCFPLIAQRWLSESDDIDHQVVELGFDKLEDSVEDEEEEEYGDLIPPPGPNDPETLWETVKKNKGKTSESMDKLMNLAGLKNVKDRALCVAYEVILKPPKTINSNVSMNFLFVVS